MTVPEIFFAVEKVVHEQARILYEVQKLQSQQAATVIILKKLTDLRSIRDARIDELEKENKHLHRLLEDELGKLQ